MEVRQSYNTKNTSINDYIVFILFQPSLIGSCGIPLKSILKSESLYISRDMEVRQSINTKNTSINDSRHSADGFIGALKVHHIYPNTYPVNIFVLKILSVYYICYIYLNTLGSTFIIEVNTMNPDQAVPKSVSI